MLVPEMFVVGRGRWVVLLSAVSVLFTITHSVDDFQNNIAGRFGVPVLVAALLLAAGYAIQVWATALAARDIRLGYWMTLSLRWFGFSLRSPIIWARSFLRIRIVPASPPRR
jgi:hypothetical protein